MKNKFYKNMPEEFRKSIEKIMEFCQFEDCDSECEECPYPLHIIRCGDLEKYEISSSLDVLEKEYNVEEISENKFLELTKEKEDYTFNTNNEEYKEYCLIELLPRNKQFIVLEDYIENSENGITGWFFKIAIKLDNKFYVIVDAD